MRYSAIVTFCKTHYDELLFAIYIGRKLYHSICDNVILMKRASEPSPYHLLSFAIYLAVEMANRTTIENLPYIVIQL